MMNRQTRGSSDPVRTAENVSMNIDITDLPIGAYSVWWVIFNNPAGCSDGECGENDMLPPPSTPEAEVSAVGRPVESSGTTAAATSVLV